MSSEWNCKKNNARALLFSYFEYRQSNLAAACLFCIVLMRPSMGILNSPSSRVVTRFDAISTSNLEVYKFRDWWIFTYFIFGHGESSPNNIWSMVNLERTCVLLFYYFLYFKVNLALEKTNQLGESSSKFIFALVNLDPIILEKEVNWWWILT